MGSDITNALGMPKRDKRSQAQKDEIAAANAMKPVDFSTPHGSQGVTNPNYAEYVKMHPDLMANYNANWSGKGVSLAEFGAMHWNSAGRKEGRTMPGIGGGGGDVGYSGGSGGMLGGGNFDTSGNPIGPYPFENVFFPQLTQAYERPAGNDYRNLFASYGFTGPLAQMEGAYEPGTVEGADLVPGGILEYQPPRLNTGLPTFVGNPYGSLQLPENWEELLTLSEEEGDEKKNRGQSGEMKDYMGNPVGDDYVHPGDAYGGPTLKFT